MNASLFEECYFAFRKAKETVALQPSTTSLQAFETARIAVNTQFANIVKPSVELTLMMENFARYCSMFLDHYRLSSKPHKDAHSLPVVVHSEKHALKRQVFEEQRNFLKKQMREAFLQGRFEDAAVMEQSLLELQQELAQT
jgi:hypothetical protein